MFFWVKPQPVSRYVGQGWALYRSFKQLSPRPNAVVSLSDFYDGGRTRARFSMPHLIAVLVEEGLA
jgi:hypothetical protein